MHDNTTKTLRPFWLLTTTLVAASVTITIPLHAETLNVPLAADTFLRSDAISGTAQGGGAEILIGELDATHPFHGLLTFNLAALSGLPGNATINSITLSLQQGAADASSANSAITLDLHQIPGVSFDEVNATWKSRRYGVLWTSEGGDYNTDVLASATANPATSSAPVIDWTGASLTAAVLNAFNNNETTISFLLKDAGEGTDSARHLVRFASKENANASFAIPALVIDYSIPAIPESASTATIPGILLFALVLATRLRSTALRLLRPESAGKNT